MFIPKRDFSVQIEAETGSEYDPEKTLLAAIVDQAVADLFSARPSRRAEAKEWAENRRSAIAFLFGPESQLELYCDYLGLNAELIRRGISLRLEEAGLSVDVAVAA